MTSAVAATAKNTPRLSGVSMSDKFVYIVVPTHNQNTGMNAVRSLRTAPLCNDSEVCVTAKTKIRSKNSSMAVALVLGLPATLGPFVQAWPFRAEGGVRAVAGVDDGVVGEGVEKPLGDIFEEAAEFAFVAGLADSAGEEAIADEEVGATIDGGGECESARGVSAEDDGGELMAREFQGIAVLHFLIYRGGQCRSIEEGRDVGGPGCLEDVRQGADVVGVPVRGDHVRDASAVLVGEGEEGGGVVCGVDKHGLAARNEQVTVVVHVGNADLVED